MYKNLTEVSIYVIYGRATDESLEKLNTAIIKEAGGHQRKDKGLFIPATFSLNRIIEMAKEIVEPESGNPVLCLEFYKGYDEPPSGMNFKELAETSEDKKTDYGMIKPISLWHKEATVYINNPKIKGGNCYMRYIYALIGDLRPYEDSARWEAGEKRIGVFCELTASKENYEHFQWLSDFMGLHVLGGFGIPSGISKDEQELLTAIYKCGATYNHYDLRIELVGVELDGQIFRK